EVHWPMLLPCLIPDRHAFIGQAKHDPIDACIVGDRGLISDEILRYSCMGSENVLLSRGTERQLSRERINKLSVCLSLRLWTVGFKFRHGELQPMGSPYWRPEKRLR